MYLKKIWLWIVRSSNNPQKLSLTLKNFIPFVLLFSFGDNVVNEADLNQLAESVVTIIVAVATIGTGIGSIYGFARKILSSLK